MNLNYEDTMRTLRICNYDIFFMKVEPIYQGDHWETVKMLDFPSRLGIF